MREVLGKHGSWTNDGIPQSKNENEKVNRETTHRKTKAINQKWTFLVRNGPFTSLIELERVRKAVHEAIASDYSQKAVGISEYVKPLSISLGAKELSMPVHLIFEMLAELKINPVTARHVQLQYPSSAYCSG